ncbi:MAG: hypothetical protein HOP15_15175 [Planctomycetes bacterium]|nr:hypothetical protein [Planctomycetota bacterium]
MPTQKDLKRLVRARMKKTGERYTAARAQVLAKRPLARKPPKTSKAARAPSTKDLAALAGMSDTIVANKTGRTWQQWVDELDRAGAAALPHAKIAQLLSDDFGTPSWWTQMLAVGYERIRGLREKGQQRDGSFAVNKSKTYPVPLSDLWTAFVRCERWLDGAKLRMSKATKPKYMRMRWADGTPVEAGFTAKGAAKSQVALSHSKLATRAEADRLRVFWGERLVALGRVLAAKE